MTHSQKIKLIRILLGASLLIAVRFVPADGYLRVGLYLIPYLLLGYDTLWKAIRGCLRGQIFDEDFLMAVASTGAFIIGEYPEAVAVMLFNQIGVLFEQYAVGKSRRSIAALMDIRPDYANLEKDGALTEVFPDEVAVGDIIVVKPGEKIPLDGVIEEGETTVDTAALTGESVPRDLRAGNEVVSGTVNLTGRVRVRVTKIFEESTVSKILELVENASSKKAKAENFISKFSRFYTPTVVGAAILLAIVPSLIDGNWSVWIYRALTFLVISCPCALVISVPLSFFGGIGAASREGILVKGSAYLEALATVGTVVFDKTGTLTVGRFSVDEVVSDRYSRDEVLLYAASAEQYSTHPMAKAVCEATSDDLPLASAVKEMPGRGVSAVVDGEAVLVGNALFFRENGIEPAEYAGNGSIIHVAVRGAYIGYILLRDKPKDGARLAIAGLTEKHIRTVVLSGDRRAAVEETANALGVHEFAGELLASDKVARLAELLKAEAIGKKLAFVGDGVNDAPVLAMADVGIAMGALGSDAAIEAADVVLMDDKPEKVIHAIDLARRTLRIVRQNVVFAIGVKIAVLILGACGYAPLLLAVFADVGVAIIAILNAMRALQSGNRYGCD